MKKVTSMAIVQRIDVADGYAAKLTASNTKSEPNSHQRRIRYAPPMPIITYATCALRNCLNAASPGKIPTFTTAARPM